MPVAYDQFIGWGEETAWGTPVARTHWSRGFSGTVADDEHDREPSALLGAIAPQRAYLKRSRGAGRIILPLYYGHSTGGGLGKLLKHLLGVYAVSGAGPYTHTLTCKQGGPPYAAGAVATAQGLSIETNYQFPDTNLEARLCEGAAITDGVIDIATENEMQIEFGYAGEQVTQIQKSTPSAYVDLDVYQARTSQVAVSLNGTDASSSVESIRIEINRNTNEYTRLGSSRIRQPLPGARRDIKVTIKRDWDTVAPSQKSLWDLFVAGTIIPVIVTITGPTNYSHVITMQKLLITRIGVTLQEGGPIPSEIEGFLLDHATDTQLKWVETSLTLTTY